MVTKSSYEAELVALCDGITAIMGCRNFLSDLEVKLVISTIYEDNRSVLDMIKSDGPFSLRTRHLNIKLFFINQFVKNDDIIIRFCRTDAMVADILTKPVIGKTFRKLRDIMVSKTDTEFDH